MGISICDAIIASISMSALKMLIFKSSALQMQMDKALQMQMDKVDKDEIVVNC